MGFLDVLMGKRKLAAPAEDRLFAISTAYVKFETELQITTLGRLKSRRSISASICCGTPRSRAIEKVCGE